jgi:hypothetical protein
LPRGKRFGAVGLAGSPLCLFAGVPSANLRAHDLAAPNDLSIFGAHADYYSGLGEGLQLY